MPAVSAEACWRTCARAPASLTIGSPVILPGQGKLRPSWPACCRAWHGVVGHVAFITGKATIGSRSFKSRSCSLSSTVWRSPSSHSPCTHGQWTPAWIARGRSAPFPPRRRCPSSKAYNYAWSHLESRHSATVAMPLLAKCQAPCEKLQVPARRLLAILW